MGAEQKRRPRVTDLEPTNDQVLEEWYLQQEKGVPVEDRVQLTPEQVRHVEAEALFSAMADAYRQTEKIGYDTGRPAVSMSDLDPHK